MRFYGAVFVVCIFLCVDFIESFEGCENRFESYFPKCNCTGENYGWSYDDRECKIICPSISKGKYPKCKCRFGDKYDIKTNSCPNPICPSNTTTDSVYPNCNCIKNNFEYNAYFNVCFRVCPPNSTGRFPNCKCDDSLAGFSKSSFECKRCPPGSKPEFLYPNCKSATNPNATFGEHQNVFYECPTSAYGSEYNCHCKNGNIFKSDEYDDPYQNVSELDGYFDEEEEVDEKTNEDQEQEYNKIEGRRRKRKAQEKKEGEKVMTDDDEDDDSDLDYEDNAFDESEVESKPESESESESIFNSESVSNKTTSDPHCSHCPNPKEVFPNCTCEEGRVFDGLYCRRCPPNATGLYGECKCEGQATYVKGDNRCRACSKNSVGKYPNCSCVKPLYFEVEKNECVGCPSGTSGKFPKCRCQSESAVFIPPWRSCRECPENSTGRFPNCTCTEVDHVYSAYINKCYIECGNGTGIHPDCYCGSKFDSIYDVEARFCKPIGYFGRPCPPGSVGIAPDCRCAVGVFQHYGWGCFFAYAYGNVDFECDRWPQCDLGIDRNTLLSLVG